MIAELLQQGYFKEATLEGKKVLILKHPVQIVIKKNVLDGLRKIYPLHEETGGILYAFPDSGNLVVTAFTQLPNNLTGGSRKTGYQPIGSAEERQRALNAGALPIRFHSHPVEIYENPYDRQPLTFFQKTSTADRHNSYLPFSISGVSVLLPDGLLSSNDRTGSDVRFYVYGGLVAPDSLKALLTSEKLYIYFASILILLTLFFSSSKKALTLLLFAGALSVVVFLLEKRPSGVLNADGDLIIKIY